MILVSKQVPQTLILKQALLVVSCLALMACSTTSKTDQQNRRRSNLIDLVQSEIKKDNTIGALKHLNELDKNLPLQDGQVHRLSDSLVFEARRGVTCSTSLISALENQGSQISLEALSLFKSQMVLCLPILKMALESNNPAVQKLVSESIIKHTRLKRFEQIKGLHRVVLKKHQKQMSVTSYATELIKHAVIHKNLAEGLDLSRKLADQKCQNGESAYCSIAKQHKRLLSEIYLEQETQRQSFKKLSQGFKEKDAKLAWGVISISFAPYLKTLNLE